MKPELFFPEIKKKLFNGKLLQSQVDGINAIIQAFAIEDNPHFTAYALATAFHETAKTMQAIKEYGRGAGKPYGKKIKHSGLPYSIPNQIYYGRGLVQLTWFENYQLMSRLLKIDLLNNPDLALDLKISVEIMYEGMTKGASSFGDFTGKCLEMYFPSKNMSLADGKKAAVSARKIINGTDKAELIAGYYEVFYKALLLL